MKIVFLDAVCLGDTPLDPIARLGELITYQRSTPEQSLERVAEAEVLIVNKIKVTGELLDAAPKLRLVCEAATGMDNIDLEAASVRGITVKNAAGYSTNSVAQVVFTQILNLCLDSSTYDRRVKDGTYSASGFFTDLSYPFAELSGKTLGIVGLGAIGSRVARIGEAFGMNVIYFSTTGRAHATAYRGVDLNTLLRESDVVSVHAPLTASTDGLIGYEQLCIMKPSALLVNMARGRLVPEEALARAINEGRIAGAAVDVYEREPLPSGSPLLHTAHPERLRLSPHMAWTSIEARRELVQCIADNIASIQ